MFGIGADLSGLSQVGGCVEDGWFVEPHLKSETVLEEWFGAGNDACFYCQIRSRPHEPTV